MVVFSSMSSGCRHSKTSLNLSDNWEEFVSCLIHKYTNGCSHRISFLIWHYDMLGIGSKREWREMRSLGINRSLLFRALFFLFFFKSCAFKGKSFGELRLAALVLWLWGQSIAEIQILFSFRQSDGSRNSLVTSQLEHRNTRLYKFHPHFQGF